MWHDSPEDLPLGSFAQLRAVAEQDADELDCGLPASGRTFRETVARLIELRGASDKARCDALRSEFPETSSCDSALEDLRRERDAVYQEMLGSRASEYFVAHLIEAWRHAARLATLIRRDETTREAIGDFCVWYLGLDAHRARLRLVTDGDVALLLSKWPKHFRSTIGPCVADSWLEAADNFSAWIDQCSTQSYGVAVQEPWRKQAVKAPVTLPNERAVFPNKPNETLDNWCSFAVSAYRDWLRHCPQWWNGEDIEREFAESGLREEQEQFAHVIESKIRGERESFSTKPTDFDRRKPCPVVQLRGTAFRPTIRGKEVDELTEPYYRVVEALVQAGPDGLSRSELERVRGDAIKYLRNLRGMDPAWNSAIKMARRRGGRYAIRQE